MAVKIIIFFLIGAIFFVIAFDSYPSHKAFGRCLNALETDMHDIEQFAKKNNWENSELCRKRYEQLIIDLACVDSVKNSYKTGRVVFSITPNRVNINTLIRKHNSYCYNDTIPLYSF